VTVRLAPSVWQETLRLLRDCGRRDVECVVYWTAPIERARRIDRVVHGDHTSTAWHYELHQAWLTEFMVLLHKERRTVLAQVHTHCAEAFHSATDDKWPLVRTPGFLSLVLPRFASEFDLDDLYLAEVNQDGSWQQVHVQERFEGIS